MMLARRCIHSNGKRRYRVIDPRTSSRELNSSGWNGSSSRILDFHHNIIDNEHYSSRNNKRYEILPCGFRNDNRAGTIRTIMTKRRGGLYGNHNLFSNQPGPYSSMTFMAGGSRRMSTSSDGEGWVDGWKEYVGEYVPSSKMIWGGTGWLLETLHMDGLVPYSLCFVGTNLIVRTALIPLVIKGARTAAHLATVAPEIQFLVSLFQRDLAQMRQPPNPRPLQEQLYLMKITWQTLRQIYKLHKVSPLDVLKSPLMQLPFFWYVSIDIRKIINGANPELAQQLTESSYLGYGLDLTEADPYYGLPILGGMLLYLNVELAMGKRALSGETSSKSNIAQHLKDFFQSLAIFMPCFMAHSPAGVQIYLATSFVFTLGQGMALRNDHLRQYIGLPAMNAPKSPGKLATEFIQLKQTEQKAQQARQHDDQPIYGAHSVLAHGWETSFLGTHRPSTISTTTTTTSIHDHHSTTITYNDHLLPNSKPTTAISNPSWGQSNPPSLTVSPDAKPQPTPLITPFPNKQPSQENDNHHIQKLNDSPTNNHESSNANTTYMEQVSEAVMEAANRGERLEPEPKIISSSSSKTTTTTATTLNTKRFTKQNHKQKRNTKSKRRNNR